ncbi:glutamine amidotransferase [Rubripirellula obstinata]|uniref:Glutamine amidotransferase n=1 Tax=Rubripirellula obstinata TaxID=406547 RepID=A0A5B1CJK9_9BACT|nr:type 1 glutamine amidotransferase [Rubripirellula obstinata]KAA1261278.1 glutamine amidotransferase [Rubripirellula obstinata]
MIQHTAVDSPGITSDVLDQNQVETKLIRIDRGDQIPTQVESDVLMTFGGPVSLHLPNPPPWVEPERELIRQYAKHGRRVFGICLGSQLIASALGAKTGPNTDPEFGWHAVDRVNNSGQSKLVSELPSQITALHWHQNTFELPNEATHLYQSDACTNQAFSIDDRIIGFQFHPEATAKTIDYYLKFANPSRILGRYVQTADQIRQGVTKHLKNQNQMLQRFLESWLKL